MRKNKKHVSRGCGWTTDGIGGADRTLFTRRSLE